MKKHFLLIPIILLPIGLYFSATTYNTIPSSIGRLALFLGLMAISASWLWCFNKILK